MKTVSESLVYFTSAFLDIDVREVEHLGERYLVTFTDGIPSVVCSFGDFPKGETLNGETRGWVRRWGSENGDLPEEFIPVVDKVR